MSQAVACHLVTPLPVHQDSRSAELAVMAWCCDDCEHVTRSPIRAHSKTCNFCHWEKQLPPRVKLAPDAYLAPGKCPDCNGPYLRYSTQILCPECKGDMQSIAVHECHGCGELVATNEFVDHLEACR